MLPAFHFHSVLLIFVNLWPISTLCVADMVCGRYRRFPEVCSSLASSGEPHPLLHITTLTTGRVCVCVGSDRNAGPAVSHVEQRGAGRDHKEVTGVVC